MPKIQDVGQHINREINRTPSPNVSVKTVGDFQPSSNEHTLKYNNSIIVLGGASKNTPEISKAVYDSTITLIAGLGTAVKNKPPEGKNLLMSNKFYYDSAVIQVCEQTDVDSNFGCKNVDTKSRKSSAIALKADEVRLFSRGSVKIVTGIDQMDKDQMFKADKNAPTHQKRDFSGISLIAGNSSVNDGDLHPIVLGKNLEEFLNKVLDEINTLYGVIKQLFEQQHIINNAMRDHTHLSDFTLNPLPQWTDEALNQSVNECGWKIVEKSQVEIPTQKVMNVENLRKKYLEPNINKYINSLYNKTN